MVKGFRYKTTERNTFHSIFWLQLPDFAKYRLEHVWMVFDSRNASEMRLGRILSITNIIQVPWTRITSTKVHFQGSGKMLRNTLHRAPFVTTASLGSDKQIPTDTSRVFRSIWPDPWKCTFVDVFRVQSTCMMLIIDKICPKRISDAFRASKVIQTCPGNTSRNLRAEAKKYYGKCYA